MKSGLPYKEGDWFAVPLRAGGYGVGLIARSRLGGEVLFGYFFGPRSDDLPRIEKVGRLRPSDAILVGQFGDLKLMKGDWRILGRLADWDRSDWPMPLFARIDDSSGKAWLIRYSEDDPNHEVSAVPCALDDARRRPRDAMMGAGAVEIRLTRALSGTAST